MCGRVQAGIDRIDPASRGRDLRPHALVDGGEIGLAEQAPPHRGLVRHHHHGRAHAIDLAQAFQRFRQELEFGPGLDVVGPAPVDHAVAIQEDSRLSHPEGPPGRRR